MKMTIIGIYDKKAGVFVEMSSTQNIGVATRHFQDAINKQSESPIYKWPEDFELYDLGEWDTETGIPTPHTKGKSHIKKLVVTGESLKVRN